MRTFAAKSLAAFASVLSLLVCLFIGLAWTPAASGPQVGPAGAADPNAGLAKPHGGKVWVQEEAFPATEGVKLGDYLAGKKPAAEITAKVKDGPWVIHYLAVFKKPAIKGPMTVQFFESTDRKNIVDQYSPTLESPAVVFQSSYELSPNLGFNKGRTYLINVGPDPQEQVRALRQRPGLPEVGRRGRSGHGRAELQGAPVLDVPARALVLAHSAGRGRRRRRRCRRSRSSRPTGECDAKAVALARDQLDAVEVERDLARRAPHARRGDPAGGQRRAGQPVGVEAHELQHQVGAGLPVAKVVTPMRSAARSARR